jgi:hypothetical protein
MLRCAAAAGDIDPRAINKQLHWNQSVKRLVAFDDEYGMYV